MDTIDRVIEQWAKEKPELDTEPMAIMGRLMRVAKYMESRVAALHKKYDLKMGEFDVLATLRRAGSPYCLTPSALVESMMLTSGAMTNRLDKLEKKGFITRIHNKEDRRSVTVELTREGLTLINKLILEHVAVQQSLLHGLDKNEKMQVNQALKLLLLQFD